jgi:hypothetical protein
MNKRLHTIAVLLFFTTISMAQEVPGAVEKKKKGCGCAYSPVFSLGLLEGEKGGQVQLQTIQGIRYGKWSTGIGVALDYYHMRSIPVFLNLRRDILKTKNSPFVYADGGIHFPWATKEDKPNYGSAKFRPGLYYEAGLGYKIGNKKGSGVLLSAGYSYKYLKEERITPVCIYWGCEDETTEMFRYKLNRLSLKLGVQL